MRLVLTLMILLAFTGCGGGGSDRPATSHTAAAPIELRGSDVYENVAGADPRDTWKPTQAIRSYFDLEEGAPGQNLSRLKGTVLGSRDGITYTQQMSGPTDTIDIDFTGYFSSMPDFVQGALERAGKSWSYRLKDVLGPHQLTDEVVTRLGRDERGYIILYYNDGILVDADTDYQNPAWDYRWAGSGRGRHRQTQVDGDDFTARSGWLEVTANTIERGGLWMAFIASHEVGHAIGHNASELTVGPDAHPKYREDTIFRYVDFERGVWTGPAVTAANGGRQVSFQKNDDGEIDFGHLGACPMIMSYCGDDRAIPHEMDFAFMKDIGYTVADAYPTAPEMYSYGAWAEHSEWSVTVSRALIFDPFRIDDFIGVNAEATGQPTVPAFADVHTGTVTWNGSLLATDLRGFAPVFGNAAITLSADTLDGTVRFTELETVQKTNRGHVELATWRRWRLDYPVIVSSNGFQDEDGRVMGNFYGPSHEEAAGALHDKLEGITGAFGGRRRH